MSQLPETAPDPPILAFFRFPCFFRFPIFLAFSCVFPSFSKDFRGSAKRKTLAFFGEKPLLFPKKQGLEGQDIVLQNCRKLRNFPAISGNCQQFPGNNRSTLTLQPETKKHKKKRRGRCGAHCLHSTNSKTHQFDGGRVSAISPLT